MVWNPPQMQIQQLILGPKKWDPAVLSGSSSTTHGKCPHGVRRLRGMIFQQRIWQRPFFFTSSGSFHQVDGTLGNPLRRPWRCFESSWHVMVWPDVWAEKKTSEDWHFDAWRSKWVNQQFSLDSSARSIYTGSSRNMLGGQLVPFHLRAVFVLKRDKEENMMYIYIYYNLHRHLIFILESRCSCLSVNIKELCDRGYIRIYTPPNSLPKKDKVSVGAQWITTQARLCFASRIAWWRGSMVAQFPNLGKPRR